MSIKETIARLEEMADDREDKVLPGCIGWDEIEPLREAAALLRTHQDAQPNEPLTLDELRGMVRQPIWMECKHFSGWAILHLAWPEIYVSAADGNTYFIWANGEYNERLGAKLYRRPPKEEHHEETP